MDNYEYTKGFPALINIVIWGALWGIFEATAGYLLHLISFGYSWLIWYPVACFFMTNIYRKTRKISSVVFVGLLSAAIKMLNLFLPGSIDKVINPAISIVFQALILATVVCIANRVLDGKYKSPLVKALMALSMNIGWRMLYVLYLLFLVPGWIRDASVVSSTSKFISFFITHNLITTTIIYIGYQYKTYLFMPLEIVERHLSYHLDTVPRRTIPILKPALAVLLLCLNITLQFMLR